MAANPYRPGTLEYLAQEQVNQGYFPNLATAILALRGTHGSLPSDLPGVAGNPPAAKQPEPPPSATTVPPGVRPGNAPTPLPTAAPGAAPAPGRTYDKKGHASDGSQSVGLDNPWKIGAFEGGTYDHNTLAELAGIADGKQQGSISAGEAAYILRTVGFVPDGQPNYEQRWAASRKLDRYAQTPEAGGSSPWWHDPANAPDEATREAYGGAYRNEQEARDNYGWWDQEGGKPTRRQNAPAAPSAEAVRIGGGEPTYGPPQDMPEGVQRLPVEDQGYGPRPTAPVPGLDVAPVTQNLRDWWNGRG